jgi:hypothetical protein
MLHSNVLNKGPKMYNVSFFEDKHEISKGRSCTDNACILQELTEKDGNLTVCNPHGFYRFCEGFR